MCATLFSTHFKQVLPSCFQVSQRNDTRLTGSESHNLIAHTDKVPAALLALWAWVIAGWSLCYKASVAEQWPCSRSLASRPFGVSPKWIPNSVQTL